MTLKEILIDLRARKWTQKAIAGEIGVDQTTISKWLQGKHDPFAPYDRLISLHRRVISKRQSANMHCEKSQCQDSQ